MSAATPSSASSTGPAHAAQANARPGAPGQRKPGPQDAADLFASMLSLLSATDDTPAIPLMGDAALENPADLAGSPQAQGDAVMFVAGDGEGAFPGVEAAGEVLHLPRFCALRGPPTAPGVEM